MNLTYRACKSQIVRQSYISKEDMQQKLDIFLTGDRIIQEQYTELGILLTQHKLGIFLVKNATINIPQYSEYWNHSIIHKGK